MGGRAVEAARIALTPSIGNDAGGYKGAHPMVADNHGHNHDNDHDHVEADTINTIAQGDLTKLLACHDCDLLLARPEIEAGQKARCPRCGYAIAEKGRDTLNAMIAAAITALLLMFVAIASAFIGFSARGQSRDATLVGSISTLWDTGYPVIAFLAFVFVVVMPGFYLLGVLYVTLKLKRRKRGRWTVNLLNGIFHIRTWAMAEVFLIGALISLIKIAGMASVELGLGFWSFMLFCVAFPVVISMTDRHQLWEWHLYGYHEA